VPGARPADVEHVLREAAQHRLEAREGGRVGAHHDVEPALLGLDRRARERRVDEDGAGALGRRAHPRRGRRLARRAVDDHEAGALRGEQAVLAGDDRLDLRRARHAEEDDLRVLGERPRGGRLGGAGGEQVGHPLAVAVHREGERVALREQVLRHAVPHEAGRAHESDRCHACLRRRRRAPHRRPPGGTGGVPESRHDAGMRAPAPPLVLRQARVLDAATGALGAPSTLLLEAGRIARVAPAAADVPLPPGAAAIDCGGRTVLPGLIDLHVHVTATRMDLANQQRMPNAFVLLRALPILSGMLDRGFTTVRDAAGADRALADAIEQGLCEGPRLFVAGHALSQTGGHGDMRSPTDFLDAPEPCACSFRIGQLSRVVDGVDAVRKAVREELQMGAHQIKVMASGGVASPADPIDALGYSRDELRAIVEEARARHTYVMAHAYTPEAIVRAVECGIRTIEHGNLVDARAADAMAAHGAFAVPTLVTYRALVEQGPALGLPPESQAKAAGVFERGLASLATLRAAGVPIGFGTDLLGATHGRQSEEFAIRGAVLPPLEVLRSATVVAAEVLGRTGELGVVAEGARADLLVVDGDPSRSADVLARPAETLRLVVQAGAVVRRNGLDGAGAAG
jgi:imidazolonepropionase-like amidohydrolase